MDTGCSVLCRLVPSAREMVAVLVAVGKALLALLRDGTWRGDLGLGSLTTAS